MPVVLRGGLLDDRPAMVPVEAADGRAARVPRRFGTMGWITATAICAFSVYAVRDTIFAPLATSEAPPSAWETKHAPGDTTPLIAASGTVHPDLDDPHESVTGTTLADDAQVDHLGPVNATGAVPGAGPASTPEGSSTGSANAEATTSTAGVVTSSTPSTSTPDTLGGHGGNSGSGKGGAGSGSGSP